jgi:HAD superfamily hydrolase (TIGR01458 family)
VTGVFKNVKGILLDMDGVVHVGDSPIAGAAEVLTTLSKAKTPYCFVTNTTTKSPSNLCAKLTAMGLPVDEEAILTTHEVAAEYLRKAGHPSCFLLVTDNALPAYRHCKIDETTPDTIVIGDIGDGWNYALLNRVFNMVMDGSDMIALHKGRYWQTEAGLQMDIGAFVSGLEYVTGKKAVVVGKPSATFFETALRRLGLGKDEAIMIGDDIETDVGGAQQAGISGVLVRTGKYREDVVKASTVTPDAVIDSVADLMTLF